MIREAIPAATTVAVRSAAEALQVLRTRRVEMTILGLILPDMHGTQLLWLALKQRKLRRALIVSDRIDACSYQLLQELNVNGLFDSAVEGEVSLREAIQAVWEKRCYYSRPTRGRLGLPAACGSRLARILTPAELRVLIVIADGTDDRQCGRRLGIHASTAHTHRESIMRKLGVRSRAELMKYCLRCSVTFMTAENVLVPNLVLLKDALPETKRPRNRPGCATTRGLAKRTTLTSEIYRSL